MSLLSSYLKTDKNVTFVGNIDKLNHHFANTGNNLASKIPHKSRIEEQRNLYSFFLEPIA